MAGISFSVELWSSMLKKKNQHFESHANTAVIAAILCLAVWVCDIVNKASVCGTCVYDVTRQLFWALLW